eukprot:m.262253 g.262253  ORF g.262253 m.262253 type:complete len:112 (+) comp15588_c0_seq3:2866-3201(+)
MYGCMGVADFDVGEIAVHLEPTFTFYCGSNSFCCSLPVIVTYDASCNAYFLSNLVVAALVSITLSHLCLLPCLKLPLLLRSWFRLGHFVAILCVVCNTNLLTHHYCYSLHE